MAEGGVAEGQTISVPIIDPVILQNRRVDITHGMDPDCVQSVLAGMKPLLGPAELDTISAAEKCSTKVTTLMEYLQRRVRARSYDAFNAFVKIIAGSQPELFTSLAAGRVPTPDEADFCIENYVEAVKDCIKSRGHSTESKIDPKIDLDVHHIQLTLVEDRPDIDSSLTQVEGQGLRASVSAATLLGDEEEQEKPQKILLHGRAGIGKSTMNQWFARQWGTGAGWGSCFKLLFLLQLRMLVMCDYQVTTIELLAMFSLYQVSDPGLISCMKAWLRNSANKVIIFIDGLDEVAEFTKRWKNCREITDPTQKAHPIELCLNILHGRLLPGCTVVATSRPFTGLSELRFDKQFEIMGFSESDVEQFVQRRHPSEAESIMSDLRESPLLMSVCSIAFYCGLVSGLLAEGVVFRDEDLQTYSRLIAFILVQFVSRKLTDWPFVMEVKSYFPKLARLAYNGIFGDRTEEKLVKVVFDEYDICRADLTTQDVKAAQDVGLLQTKKVKHGLRQSVVAEFFHLSVQEMLAAAYLLAHPSSMQNLILDLLSGGQFNIALLYMFGLRYDTSSHWIKDIRFAVSASTHVSKVSFDSLISLLLDHLCKQGGGRNKLQVCQLLYEGRMEDKAKDVSSSIVPNDSLGIGGTPLTMIDLRALSFVWKYVQIIRNISFVACHLTDSLCCLLVSGLLTDHADTLTRLDLSANKLTHRSAMAIAEWLKGNETLQFLNLVINAIDSTGAEALGEMLCQNTHLRELHVSGNRINDNGAKALGAALCRNHSLRVLGVGANNISEDGAESLAAALRVNTSLTELHIERNNISDKGTSTLAEALKHNNSLHELFLHQNKIGYKGAAALAEALYKNKGLQTLNLDCNTISDLGAQALAQALIHHNNSLEVLNVYQNNIGCPGKEALDKVKEHNDGIHIAYGWQT